MQHYQLLFLYHNISGTCNIQLKTLLRELTSVSGSQWLNLGIQLDIEDSTLEDIEANHRGDVHRCKTEMLRAWLQSDPTNPWTKLATALKHMKYKVLAQRILEKYNTVMPKSDSERCIKKLWVHFWEQFCGIDTSSQL